MKRMLAIVLTLILVVVLVGCEAGPSKETVFEFVEENYEAIVAACENKDVEALLALDGVEQVKLADGYVLVFCGGAGISVSSQDYGFYYSEDNSPVAVDCNLEIVCNASGLSPEGDGYQYYDSAYNGFYTEHIKGNIYFYSNAY